MEIIYAPCKNTLLYIGYLKSNSVIHKIPCYFLVGDRRTNILLTRIRNMCSGLNADLNRVNLTDLPFCNCGNPCEDAYHFLMECPNYTRYKTILFDKLRNFEPLNVVKLLFGDFNLNVNDNRIISSSYGLFKSKDIVAIFWQFVYCIC